MSSPRFLVVLFIALTGLILQTSHVMAQQAVFGSVRDAKTGESLPHATIQIELSAQHAVTNPDGQFRISVLRFPATLLVRHIGYKTARILVEQRINESIHVQLEPVVTELGELVVSGEDPAVAIMREVIARKKQWRDSVRTTYAEVYTRFWLFRQFDPILMEESIRSSHWRADGGSREIIRARRTRPPRSKRFRFAGATYVPNFYDDTVFLYGSTYYTPTHPDAFDYYKFRLGEKRMMDDVIIWDIYFTPKSSTRPSFSGHVAVMDSIFAILEMDLRPQPGILVSPPMKYHDVQYEQRFGSLRGGVMMPLNLTARGALEFGRLGASFPQARYEQYSNVTNYALDAPLPDSMYSDQRTQRQHPLVDGSDFLFSRNPTITPMTPHELESLKGINPRMTVNRAFRPSGMLAGFAALDVTQEDEDEAEEGSSPIVMQIVDHAWLWYNRVDGWNVGLQNRQEIGTGSFVTTKLAYTSDRHEFAGVLGVEHPFKMGRSTISVSGQVSDETRPTFDQDLYGRFLPGMITYAGYRDYYDYYRRRAARLGASYSRVLRGGSARFEISLAGNHEQHQSQQNNSNFEGWLFDVIQRPNPRIDDGDLTSFDAGIFVGTDRTNVFFRVEYADPSLPGNDFDFTTLRGQATAHLNTFFKDRERPNVLRLSVQAGAASGSVPQQRKGSIQGSTGPIALPGSFRTLSNRAMTGDEYYAVFVEHDFTTAVAEGLHLWRLADSGMELVLFAGAGKISSGSLVYEPLGWVYEIGAGLSHLFRLPLRLDLSWRPDQKSYSFRLGKADF